MDERQPLLESQGETIADPQRNGKSHIVDFDPDGDEDNPLEWSKKYRWFVIFLLSFIALTVYGILTPFLFHVSIKS